MSGHDSETNNRTVTAILNRGDAHANSGNNCEVVDVRDRRRAITAASVGQFFELYDFSIYGFFAPEIGRAFFPAADPLTSLVAAFATYGVGFVMRPVGAIVVGAYGDRVGRKAALVFTVGLMGLATGLVALLPTYNQIGIWAPILLRDPAVGSGLLDRR